MSEKFGKGVLAWGCLVQRSSALGKKRMSTASNPSGKLLSVQVAARSDSAELTGTDENKAFRVAEIFSEQGFRTAEVWVV